MYCRAVCESVSAYRPHLLLVLFAFVVIGLVIKKLREKSSRTWFEFFLDSSKQMAGASWLHVLNIAFSIVLNDFGGDECTWYWINITIDTTLGVLVNYNLHRLIYKVIVPNLCSPHMAANFKSGEYGLASGKIHWGKYFRQLLIWIFIVSIMKCTMVVIMVVGNVPLVHLGSFVLSPFKTNPDLKLIVVMVLTPLIMNTVQFWITDTFTKKKTPQVSSQPASLKHPEANADSLEYEEVPLTNLNDGSEDDMTHFPVSPFAIVFNDPDYDRRPRGHEAVEKEMNSTKKTEVENSKIGAPDPRSDKL